MLKRFAWIAALLGFSSSLLAGSAEQEAISQMAQPGVVVLDVRSPVEFAQGHLAQAQLLPLEQVAARIAEVVPDKSTPVVVYCRSGRRSAMAQATMRQLGYQNVVNGGGFEGLSKAVAALK